MTLEEEMADPKFYQLQLKFNQLTAGDSERFLEIQLNFRTTLW